MPPWRLKAAVQGVVAHVPRAHRCNQVLQVLWNRRGTLDDATFANQFSHYRFHRPVLAHRNLGLSHVFELGTGSVPVMPLALWLAGTGEVTSWDVVDLWSDRGAGDAAARLIRRAEQGMFPAADSGRVAKLAELVHAYRGRLQRATVDSLGIHVIVGDASATGLPDACVDAFVSNATLEHIPSQQITAIFTEFARLAARHAEMSHYIDLSDHYSSFDNRINAFHFLKYDDLTWRKYNNALHHQNRLRISDYRDLHRLTGWCITHERLASGSPGDLKHVGLAPQFGSYPRNELLVHRAVMISRRVGDRT